MDYLTILLVVLFGFTLYQGLKAISRMRESRDKNYPPGPPPLPIVGHLHLLGEHYHATLAELAKTYGPIMTIKLGFLNLVTITSPAMAKQALQKQDVDFSHKWRPKALYAHNQFKYSVVLLPVATRWRNLRKHMNSTMFSGARLEATQEIRQNTVQELVDYCRRYGQRGEAVDLSIASFMTTLNTLTSIVFSKNVMDPNLESSVQEMRDIMWNIAVEAGAPNLSDYYLFLKFDIQGIRRRLTKHFSRVLDLITGPVNERLEQRKLSGDNNDSANKKKGYKDALDLLLKAIDENPEEMDRTHMERMFLDLFIAGSDTTSSTLEWAMAEVLKHPHALKKAKEELARVVGKGKVIEESDVDQLPYLRCVINETLRLHPPSPTLIPRMMDQDVEFCGYTIPKGSKVMINIWGIMRDPNVWEDPLAFKPERFEGTDYDPRGLDFDFLPFGSGRRICPGMPLARRLLPVAVGSLLNSFDWELEGGIKPHELNMEEKVGLTLKKRDNLRAVPILL